MNNLDFLGAIQIFSGKSALQPSPRFGVHVIINLSFDLLSVALMIRNLFLIENTSQLIVCFGSYSGLVRMIDIAINETIKRK